MRPSDEIRKEIDRYHKNNHGARFNWNTLVELKQTLIIRKLDQLEEILNRKEVNKNGSPQRKQKQAEARSARGHRQLSKFHG